MQRERGRERETVKVRVSKTERQTDRAYRQMQSESRREGGNTYMFNRTIG